MLDFSDILSLLAKGETLTQVQSSRSFDAIMTGTVDPVQISAFLMALCVRGETVDEIVGGAKVLRSKASKLADPGDVVDTCGTGGDGLGTYNISTAAALVAAAAGCRVAKHGNRSVSSKSGSADVLMSMGANLEISLEENQECLDRFGFTFMFAPAHHQAMRHVAPVRAALKLRTVFNLLGPLANPAQAKRQVLGVYDRRWQRPMAEVLAELGSEHVWVVHGHDGLDEVSISGPTNIVELKNGRISEFEVSPEDVGLSPSPIAEIKGGDAEANAKALSLLLEGKRTAYRDITLLNAGAALVVGKQADDLAEGVAISGDVIDSGKAAALAQQWIAFTQTCGSQ